MPAVITFTVKEKTYEKNTLLPVVAAALLTAALILQTSCNLTVPQYGVLTIDFENGAARAIGANGLPELADSTMQIEITGSSIVPITKRLEKDEPKIISERVPIGETVTVTVSIITPSAIWTGSAGRTIDAGDNELAVKLNKIIASMRPLLFSVEGRNAIGYTFKLNMGGLRLTKTTPPSWINDTPHFTRDGRGRLYISYNEGSLNYKIDRYTAEGVFKDTINLASYNYSGIDNLTTDLVTGYVYVVGPGGGVRRIDNDGNVVPISGIPADTTKIAAYNGYLFVYRSLLPGGQLQMYRLTATPPAPVGTPVQDPLKDIIPITEDPLITHQSGECQDMFAYGNKVYIVFTIGAPYDGSKAFYGGVLEYTYSENGLMTESGRYGFGVMESYKRYPGPSQTRIYRFEGEPKDRFYGARRIIGFEDGVLYIADDGAILKSKKDVNGYELVDNINRIAKLDTHSGTLTFENTDATWYRQW